MAGGRASGGDFESTARMLWARYARGWFSLLGACAGIGFLTFCSAGLSGQDLTKASTSRSSRQEALQSIPLDALNGDAKRKVLSVINQTSVYRRLLVNTYLCDPDMHNFLIRYPEVVVGIWRVMGITEVAARRVEDYRIQATDGMGTTSSIELLYGTKNLHVFYGQGVYEGPLFHNRLNGSCLLVLKSDFGSNRNGDPVVSDRLDVFLRVDNIGVKILARTLHSLVGKTADINFRESTRFIGKVSETAEINGTGVGRLGDRIEGLEPEVREAFQRLAIVVNDRSAGRLQGRLKSSNGLTGAVSGTNQATSPATVRP